jgi:hypothetical protein
VSPNPKIENSLKSHYIGDTSKLISGQYDSDFLGFLLSRYNQIEPLFNELKKASINLSKGQHGDIWG